MAAVEPEPDSLKGQLLVASPALLDPNFRRAVVLVTEHGEEAPAIRRARVFAGYAGWSAGQLEAELEEPSWIVEPALREDVFADEPEGLWSGVLRRKGGQFALLATMPPNPSMN